MRNMRIGQLKIRKTSFLRASSLITYMNKYSYYMEEKDREILDIFTEISDGLPLPSGRWGNAIALALEINNYIAAEYLIENADRLKLEKDFVVSELGGKNSWSLRDEYLFSQLIYEEEIMSKIEQDNEDGYKMYLEFALRNKAANERLEKRLSMTIEDKKVLNKSK